MKFWDASAIVPLLVAEPTTRRVQALASRDPDMLVWWGSKVECVSALTRLERAAALDARGIALASDRLKQLADGWREIEPSGVVRESATVPARSPAARGRRIAAGGSLRGRRTSSGIASVRHARRACRQGGAEGRLYDGRCYRGLTQRSAAKPTAKCGAGSGSTLPFVHGPSGTWPGGGKRPAGGARLAQCASENC